MTLDERDLARLTGGDLDLDQVPVPEIGPEISDEDEPAPRRRRGRAPAPSHVRTGRAATLKDRIAAIRERAATRPGAPAGPVSGPVVAKTETSDEAPADFGPAAVADACTSPADPAQEHTVKRITQSEAAAILGMTIDGVSKKRAAGKLTSGLKTAPPPGVKAGLKAGQGGVVWTYMDSEVRELARARQKAPNERAKVAMQERRAKERDTKPEKVPQPEQEPRQAPARAAQPKEPKVKAKPRPAPPSPTPVAEEPWQDPTKAAPEPGPATQLLNALACCVGYGVVSQAKADRVLAVLLEG